MSRRVLVLTGLVLFVGVAAAVAAVTMEDDPPPKRTLSPSLQKLSLDDAKPKVGGITAPTKPPGLKLPPTVTQQPTGDGPQITSTPGGGGGGNGGTTTQPKPTPTATEEPGPGGGGPG